VTATSEGHQRKKRLRVHPATMTRPVLGCQLNRSNSLSSADLRPRENASFTVLRRCNTYVPRFDRRGEVGSIEVRALQR
jgi:hypothetical protein